MELSRETIKKIRGLIVFTTVIILCLWNYENAFSILRFIFHVTFPFVLGGAIAFVLNVPMNFVERHLFRPEKIKKSSFLKKIARPASMLLVLFLVFGVLALIMFVLIPRLGRTFANLDESIKEFVSRLQEWAAPFSHDNKEIMGWLSNIKLD